jgi:probable rRNA maturation factor
MTETPRSTSLEIAVSVHDTAWLDALQDLEERARLAVSTALRQAAVAGPLEISLVFTDDAEQRGLNRDYRHRDRATNVLSFPNMDETSATGPGGGPDGGPGGDPHGPPRLLGDVVLARETVAREARAQGKSLTDHTSHLLIHGTLHLLGYDHEEAAAAAEMETLETEILAALGIADPYAGDDGLAVAEAEHG